MKCGPALFCGSLIPHRQGYTQLRSHYLRCARRSLQRPGYFGNSRSGFCHCLQLLHICFGPLSANDLLCFGHCYSGFFVDRPFITQLRNGNGMLFSNCKLDREMSLNLGCRGRNCHKVKQGRRRLKRVTGAAEFLRWIRGAQAQSGKPSDHVTKFGSPRSFAKLGLA